MLRGLALLRRSPAKKNARGMAYFQEIFLSWQFCEVLPDLDDLSHKNSNFQHKKPGRMDACKGFIIKLGTE